MYFSSELFVKRGPLGHLWLAGTVFHKLSKKVILNCNVPEMCKSIEQPPIPLALPARAQLFLGVCRIMDKQAKYLLIDATEAQSRVQLAVTTSSVNLAGNRAQAKSDAINVVCDINDYILPPIPLDCFEIDMEKETALFLNQSNLDEICLMEDHNLLDDINLELNTSLPPQDTKVALEKMLFDPLAIVDENEAPYSLTDPNQSIFVPEEDFGQLPDIIVDEPDERRQSFGSVRSKATADTFNVSLISKKRKRNRPKPDSKIVINIDVLKHELADTSRIVTARPRVLQEAPIILDQNNPLQCMRSETIRELSESLQACYDNASTRGHPNIEEPVVEFVGFDQPPISPTGFEPVEANDDILSFKSGNLSIEQARHASLPTVDENRDVEDTFLGHEIGLLSPNIQSVGSDVKLSPQQMRRISMKSLGSLDSRTGGLSSINETGASDFQTPDLDLTISQFDIPHIEIGTVAGEHSHHERIDRTTEILRSILDEHFQKTQGAQESKSCQFHSVIDAAVGPQTRISRRDAALSFLQLLVLKSMDMVTIDQSEPYGPIDITRTSSFSRGFLVH